MSNDENGEDERLGQGWHSHSELPPDRRQEDPKTEDSVDRDWLLKPENCEHTRMSKWFESGIKDEAALHIETVRCQICGKQFKPEINNYGNQPYLVATDIEPQADENVEGSGSC